MQDKDILDKKDFSKAVSMLPLISIDFCIVFEKKILLGRRNNEPAKDYLFTPGGRIRKNESFNNALIRIYYDELNMRLSNTEEFFFMGIWDHFYSKSAFDEDISTHYINIPYLQLISKLDYEKLHLVGDKSQQHSKWEWLNLKKALNQKDVHKYIKQNIEWILKNHDV